MSKINWFHHDKPQITTEVYPLNYSPDTTQMKQFGNEIKEQLDISGRMNYRRNGKNELVFAYNRPMVHNLVTVHPALDSLTVVRREMFSFVDANFQIHRIHGYQGGILYIIWAVLLDLTAISMIIFAITGFLIWYRHRKRFIYGWFIVIPSIALFIIMYLFLK